MVEGTNQQVCLTVISGVLGTGVTVGVTITTQMGNGSVISAILGIGESVITSKEI